MLNDSSDAKPKKLPVAVPADARHAPWGPSSAILVSVLSFIVGSFVAGGLTYAIAGLLGKSAHQTNEWLSSVTGQFIFVLCAESIVIGLVMLFLRYRKTTLKALGFHRGLIWKDVAFAVAGFAAYFIMLMIATALAKELLHVNVDQKQELGFDNVFTTGQRIMTFVSLVILPPLAEEILFRGFLYTGVRKRLPFIWATLFVSFIFASLHLMESSEGLLWIAGIDTFILSVVLCYLREKTGNLWAGIILHSLKNLLAFIFLYLVGFQV